MRMKLLLAAAIAAVATIVALVVVPGGAGADTSSKNKPAHDHALLDTTSGDTGAFCQANGPFEFYGSFRAINSNTVARVTFQDGDFIDFPIPVDTSYSLAQAAGDTVGVDRRLVVTNQGPGNLVGWVSASAHKNESVSCGTNS